MNFGTAPLACSEMEFRNALTKRVDASVLSLTSLPSVNAFLPHKFWWSPVPWQTCYGATFHFKIVDLMVL